MLHFLGCLETFKSPCLSLSSLSGDEGLVAASEQGQGRRRGRMRKGDHVTLLDFLCLHDLVLFLLALTGLQIASRYGFGVKFPIQELLGDTF